MNITFINPGVDYMIKSIMEFQSDESTNFWSDPLYECYPQLNKEYALGLVFSERKVYIEAVLRAYYKDIEEVINSKIDSYSIHWAKNKEEITSALSHAFGIDCSSILNGMVCKISMNPISPRFLEEESFEVYYENSERGALGISLHEIIHFVWFQVWNKEFNDSYSEYESPSLKWILSEMVVETIMHHTKLSTLNPYYPRENGGCIYSYFYDMKVEEQFVLDTIHEIYKVNDMRTFMKLSYDFYLKYEIPIREHIHRSE